MGYLLFISFDLYAGWSRTNCKQACYCVRCQVVRSAMKKNEAGAAEDRGGVLFQIG